MFFFDFPRFLQRFPFFSLPVSPLDRRPSRFLRVAVLFITMAFACGIGALGVESSDFDRIPAGDRGRARRPLDSFRVTPQRVCFLGDGPFGCFFGLKLVCFFLRFWVWGLHISWLWWFVYVLYCFNSFGLTKRLCYQGLLWGKRWVRSSFRGSESDCETRNSVWPQKLQKHQETNKKRTTGALSLFKIIIGMYERSRFEPGRWWKMSFLNVFLNLCSIWADFHRHSHHSLGCPSLITHLRKHFDKYHRSIPSWCFSLCWPWSSWVVCSLLRSQAPPSPIRFGRSPKV